MLRNDSFNISVCFNEKSPALMFSIPPLLLGNELSSQHATNQFSLYLGIDEPLMPQFQTQGSPKLSAKAAFTIDQGFETGH